MYAVLLMCLMTSFVFGIREDSYVINLTTKFVNKVQHIIEKCESETKSPPNSFRNMLEGRTEDEGTIAFMYCYLPKAGFLTNDGLFNVNTLVGLLKKDDLKAEFAKVIEDCNKLKKDNPLETLRLVSDCFYKNSPVSFSLQNK